MRSTKLFLVAAALAYLAGCGPALAELDGRTKEALFRKTVLAELRVQRELVVELQEQNRRLAFELWEHRQMLRMLMVPPAARISDFMQPGSPLTPRPGCPIL